MTGDDWRVVEGFPNYKVSRRGEVFSLVRSHTLAQFLGRRGYLGVNLYREGQPKNFLVHRLVAAAFLCAIPPGRQVNHKDGDKTNNRLENLELVTPEENRAHAARLGLFPVGEANSGSRLTGDAVREIRRMREEGVRVRDIAHHFDVSERTVYQVLRGKMWGHIQ